MSPTSASLKRSWTQSYPYKVDYNDHFETPEIAYRDILPILDWIKPSRDEHCIYDPYYCNGRTKSLLINLGFDNVVHECRDFYKDVEQDQVPEHDTLVTNPPYSDGHKEKCLAFVLEQLRTKNRPFFVLMPNYVAAKEYYRNLVEKDGAVEEVVYLLPSHPYDYDHPEGTGHVVSPFASIWYCGIGRERVIDVKSQLPDLKLVTSVAELRQEKAIPSKKRPNPKQRRKRKQQQQEQELLATNVGLQASPSPKRKKSRHRDESGSRTKRRF